jgi:hypothetical protein
MSRKLGFQQTQCLNIVCSLSQIHVVCDRRVVIHSCGTALLCHWLLIMTPHIISWASNERSISPISTTPSSVVSIDSISSESSLSRATQPRFKFMNVLGDRESVVHHANDDPFAHHDKYFFKDGNITFLVRPSLIVCDSAHRSIQGRRHPLLRPQIFLFTPFSILLY